MTETQKNPKYIFVVGGVISGVGKGITASSIAKILQDKGRTVTAIKIDPYINVDAGTMNPTEHGECFVLDDGDETDQDMGNYERFLNVDLTRINYMTTGRVYLTVIEKERNLEYDGKCVEVVPHIPLEIIRRIETAQQNAKADIVVIEIGGTVGEYQNMLFLEAARMMKLRHVKDVAFVMVSYLPVPGKVGEMKTKPTQHAVRTLNASGIQPDIIVARSSDVLDDKRKEKLSLFCNIPQRGVISAPDVESIYDIPENFEKEKLSELLCDILNMPCTQTQSDNAHKWKEFTEAINHPKGELKIAIIGKYFDTGNYVLADSYISVIEAIRHAGAAHMQKPVLTWINAIDYETNPEKVAELAQYDGVIVPGGFGARGIEGIITAISYIREHKIPYLGLCYGMQLAVVEYARAVAGITGATTREIHPDAKDLVVTIMESQKDIVSKGKLGGTMRLGSYPTALKENTLAQKTYGTNTIQERHRHRYEVNPAYVERLERAGLIFSGTSPDGTLCEVAELPASVHPFFIATQFHPEFKSRPLVPHPLFKAFIAACEQKRG